ncbi:glycosyltransferase family 4 protein [Patescibacteria group bacterium]|nr:glycosyltransferase family 4 protein [Patescibacteria group bacterium]
MRIVLDLRIFGPQFGGLGRYNQKLLEQLVILDQENHYIVLLKENVPELKLPANFEIKLAPYHWYSLKEQIFLPFILKSLKPDLVHFPHFNVPIFYFGKFIVTVHDLIMTKFPSVRTSTLNKTSFVFKRLAYHLTIFLAIKRAHFVIAVSKFTANDIKEYFKLDNIKAEKIKLIYEGLSVEQKPGGKTRSLPEKFLLYVGNAYPHKNLEFLIKAFIAWQKNHPDFHLVLVGNKNYFYQRLENYAKDNFVEYKDKIIFAGFVPDEELVQYYQQAKAYVFPSLYEGFGLPPLEAQSYDLPVLSSSSSCLPEILADSVLYFDPNSESDFKNKLDQILFDQSLRKSLEIKGREQIKKYTWEKMVDEIIELYKK